MPTDPLFLDTADRIGARLCREAVWAGRACNWLGPVAAGGPQDRRVVYQAAGPDLYGGTAGIALFLGQLYAYTGEPIYRRTALGALHQAVAYRAIIPPAQQWGFYSGWIGIAYAAHQVEAWCDYPAGAAAAWRLVDALAAAGTAAAALDVIGGAAGAIPALLWLYRRQRNTLVSDLAVQLGDRLLAAAYRGPAGWAWVTLPTPMDHPLTGFAHGGAGIAWALLELWRATGAARFRAAADHGFAYERHWFDPQTGNWPDFRRVGRSSAGAERGTGWPQGRAWCHGAPGGALARLRAYQVTGLEIYRREAEAALATTVRTLTQSADARYDRNYSLCHGQAGNADILLTAAAVLGDAAYGRLAEGVGYEGIDTVQRAYLPWPCGVPAGGEAPGLLLGLAGIGYFYLRLYDPARVPSALLIPA